MSVGSKPACLSSPGASASTLARRLLGNSTRALGADVLVCLPLVMRGAAAAHADLLAVEVEDERDRRYRARREREQQARVLEAQVVEHLVDEERHHRTALRAQERLRGHRARRVAAVRVDDV